MKDHLRGLAALVFAVTAGSVAWGITIISYDAPNDEGAAYMGGKTIRLDYTGPEPVPSHVWFHDKRVTTDLGCSVTVADDVGAGTIDIVVPPQGGLPSPLNIYVSEAEPPNPLSSDPLVFTYWPRPEIRDVPLLSQYQQKWADGIIEINVYGLPETEDPLGGTTLKYGRTLTVEFDEGNPSTQPIYVYVNALGEPYRIRVVVPDSDPPGEIGLSTQVALILTVDDGTADEMEAGEHPLFTWCPEGLTLSSINPFDGPLAGNSSAGYMTLEGTSFYPDYTYVSFDSFDGPWLSPGEIIFDSTTQLRCPLPPQPDKLEIQAQVYVKNAFEDLSTRMYTIETQGPEIFEYKDQPPFPVRVIGYLDGAVVDKSILLQAEAVDDRAIARVEFRLWQGAGAPNPQGIPPAPYWADYQLLGTDTTWPYEYLWDTALFADDDYHIIAVAYDDHVWTTIVPQLGNYPDHPEIYNATGGNIVASSDVTVTVDNDDITGQIDNPPQAQMLVPADGAVLSVDSGSITLSAVVADDFGFLDPAQYAVQFFVDGDQAGQLFDTSLVDLGTGWYLATVTWDGQIDGAPAADGPHQISVEVWDDHPGGTGLETQWATAGVTVTVDSSAVCITSISPDGSESLVGSDLAGADADTHLPLTVTITGDGFSQVPGQPTVFDGTITFADVPATDVTRVSDTELIVVVPNLGLPLSAADGTIDVGITTAAGTVVFSDMFYVEDSEPTCVFLGPQAGATVGGLVLLQVDARDDSAIVSVTYQYSATGAPGSWIDIPGGTVDATDPNVNYPFSHEYDTSVLGDGPIWFQAIATDDGGHTLTEADVTSVALTLDQSSHDNPPRVTITSPAQGATLSGSVVLEATVTDAEAASITSFDPFALPQFEIVSAGRNEVLGTIVVDSGSVVSVTTGWIMSATWDTTVAEMTGSVTFNQDSINVDGTSTRFESEFQAGDFIGESADGPWYKVASVESNIRLYLVANFTDPTVFVTPYRSGRAGGGRPLYPDGSFYLIRAAATDDADPAGPGDYNTGYDAVNVTVHNAAPVKDNGRIIIGPPTGGGGCAPGDTATPAAIFLLLGTVFLVFRRRLPVTTVRQRGDAAAPPWKASPASVAGLPASPSAGLKGRLGGSEGAARS